MFFFFLNIVHYSSLCFVVYMTSRELMFCRAPSGLLKHFGCVISSWGLFSKSKDGSAWKELHPKQKNTWLVEAVNSGRAKM